MDFEDLLNIVEQFDNSYYEVTMQDGDKFVSYHKPEHFQNNVAILYVDYTPADNVDEDRYINCDKISTVVELDSFKYN